MSPRRRPSAPVPPVDDPGVSGVGPEERLLRIRDVAARVGLSEPEIYARVAARTFPAPVRLGPHCSRFLASEVQQWIARQIATCPRSTAPLSAHEVGR